MSLYYDFPNKTLKDKEEADRIELIQSISEYKKIRKIKNTLEVTIDSSLYTDTVDRQVFKEYPENFFHLKTLPKLLFYKRNRYEYLAVSFKGLPTKHDVVCLRNLILYSFPRFKKVYIWVDKENNPLVGYIKLSAIVNKLTYQDTLSILSNQGTKKVLKFHPTLFDYYSYLYLDENYLAKINITKINLSDLARKEQFTIWFEIGQIYLKNNKDLESSLFSFRKALEIAETFPNKERAHLSSIVLNGLALLEMYKGNLMKSFDLEEKILNSCIQDNLDVDLKIQTITNIFLLNKNMKKENDHLFDILLDSLFSSSSENTIAMECLIEATFEYDKMNSFELIFNKILDNSIISNKMMQCILNNLDKFDKEQQQEVIGKLLLNSSINQLEVFFHYTSLKESVTNKLITLF